MKSLLKTEFQSTRLANGVSVVTENHPYMHAVCCGLGVSRGSRSENFQQMGIAHFLEHMVFKGTKTRTAYDIVSEIEFLGGDINAYTAREMTCFHTLTLAEDFKAGIEILCDLALNANFKPDDIESEKSVISQEISMIKDNLDEYIYDRYAENQFANHPLGYPILGTDESLKGINEKDLRQFYIDQYSPENIHFVIVGKVDHQEAVASVEKFLTSLSRKNLDQELEAPEWKAFESFEERESEQLHSMIAFPCSSYADGVFYEAAVFNAIVGASMTSKLYQRIREDLGLCYHVYSAYQPYSDHGFFSIHTATEPQNGDKALEEIFKILKSVKELSAITQEELEQFQQQLIRGVLLNADDIEGRMNSLLVDSILGRRYRDIDEILSGIRSVNFNSLAEYSNRFLKIDQYSQFQIGKKG